ncbi:MAG TPA: hypothetical protein VG406_00545 [Isosphaeraceae bacterium]|jgi:hypothetical protein|nr:hypothetical protein [Isosphaeraceae bacterium]
MRSDRRRRLQFESLENIVALSGAHASLARLAAEVAATPTSLPLSGTLRGPTEYAIGSDPTGPVSLVFSPSATVGGSPRGAVAGNLAPLGRVRLTSELTWNSPASDWPAGSGHDVLILWSRRGPTYLSVQRPATPPPSQGSTTALRYEVIRGMSGPHPTFYAPGSGTITLTLGHFHHGHGGSQLATATLTFTPDPVAAASAS